MLHLRITVPGDRTDDVLAVLEHAPGVSSLGLMRGASLRPAGDVVTADIAREDADNVIEALEDLRVPQHGTVQLENVDTWLSQEALEAERRSPGSPADSVVWAEVIQRAYEDTELNWTFLSFMSLATLLAAVAVVLDSQVLVIGAMVLGPEFGAIVGIALGVVRGRTGLVRRSVVALLGGFACGICFTLLASLALRGLGWISLADLTAARPNTDFIYTPTRWSVLVALVAGAAGVLSLTSGRSGGLAGVFISVTTIPAAGNLALAIAFLDRSEMAGSLLQLVVNTGAIALAGGLTLTFQRLVWTSVSARRKEWAARRAPRRS